jgi:hypothetical protein
MTNNWQVQERQSDGRWFAKVTGVSEETARKWLAIYRNMYPNAALRLCCGEKPIH